MHFCVTNVKKPFVLISVAFLFNCIGLFAILCVSQTVAARFGAVSGFGLSIVKYVAFMKVCTYYQTQRMIQEYVVYLGHKFIFLDPELVKTTIKI
jgi:hypothetical protein